MDFLHELWFSVSQALAEAYDGVVSSFVKTFLTDNRYKLFLNGFLATLQITVLATAAGVLIGLFVAITKVNTAQTGKMKFLTHLLNLYTTVIRGTPIVVQLLISFFIIFAAEDNGIKVAIFTFAINSGAYVSEIIRAGILAVDRGQMEAGRSLGLSRFITMVFVILPQAFKNILPALGNEFIAILKETSVAGYIAVTDLTKAGALVRTRTMDAYFSLLSVAAVYLILVLGMTYAVNKIERRLARSDRN